MSENPTHLELEIARENRRFEISMFWQRANYFLVLNTALAVGAYTVDEPLVASLISIIGFVSSLLWYRTNLGAKFWQTFWEKEVARIAEKLELSALYESEKNIRKRALSWTVDSDSPMHKRFTNWQMTTMKPEVSHNMILLSLMAAITWFFIAVVIIAPVFFKSI